MSLAWAADWRLRVMVRSSSSTAVAKAQRQDVRSPHSNTGAHTHRCMHAPASQTVGESSYTRASSDTKGPRVDSTWSTVLAMSSAGRARASTAAAATARATAHAIHITHRSAMMNRHTHTSPLCVHWSPCAPPGATESAPNTRIRPAGAPPARLKHGNLPTFQQIIKTRPRLHTDPSIESSHQAENVAPTFRHAWCWRRCRHASVWSAASRSVRGTAS